MTQRISGPGLGLPLAQNLYPSQLYNAPYDSSNNRIALAPGDTLPIPAGDWFVGLGSYCVLQFLDPVSNTWNMGPTAAWLGGHQFVVSDGFNVRVANLLGCPVSASVTNYGAGGYVQATTTITATGGTSTWVPIVGGQLTPTVISAGAGYGIAPEVFLPAPPGPANNSNGVGGIQASAWANITSGTLTLASGVSMNNPGAGYNSPCTVVLLPCPTDPNLSSGITAATVIFSLTGSGSITGALCTNPGVPITPANITLTVAGAGTQGTVVANVMQTVTAASVSGAGSGYGTISALLTTVGGAPSVGTVTNSELLGLAFRPRPAQVGLTVSAAANGTIAAQNGTIFDGGLFLQSGATAAPNFVILSQPLTATTQAYVSATISLTCGTRPDVVTIQPAP